MREILQPSIYLLATQQIDRENLRHFLGDIDAAGWQSTAYCPDSRSSNSASPLEIPEIGGRLCYMSFRGPRRGDNSDYLRHIIEAGHGSVLEHSVFSVIITGVSRSLSHELIRHRTMSYSQLSQRYVDESEGEYVVPPEIVGDAEAVTIWRKAIEHAHNSYCELLEAVAARIAAEPQYRRDDGTLDTRYGTEIRKRARGTARSVLPNACETKLMVTGNARAWRGFLDQRATTHADAEIRQLAVEIYRTLYRAAPALFADYTLSTESGYETLYTQYRKV